MAGKPSKKSAKTARNAASKRGAANRIKPGKTAAKPSRTATKPSKSAAKPSKTVAKKTSKPKLLSGGNPQIAKGYGDEHVQAYIAAMPGWKQDVGRRLDAIIEGAVPNVRKAVKWTSPFYGVEDESRGWFASFHVFTNYVKV